jgi:hypothetical protein
MVVQIPFITELAGSKDVASRQDTKDNSDDHILFIPIVVWIPFVTELVGFKDMASRQDTKDNSSSLF